MEADHVRFIEHVRQLVDGEGAPDEVEDDSCVVVGVWLADYAESDWVHGNNDKEWRLTRPLDLTHDVYGEGKLVYYVDLCCVSPARASFFKSYALRRWPHLQNASAPIDIGRSRPGRMRMEWQD